MSNKYASPSLQMAGADNPSEDIIASENWFTELDRLNSVLRAKRVEKDESYKPVKVAILDTGVRPDSEDLVEDYKDFVSGNDVDCTDGEGHGTYAVQLIRKTNNAAKIYVGRVFRRRTADDNTLSLMTQAVRHATHQWGVDVIVMPSGFQSESDDMIEAIEEARSARILVFAAAANYGNLSHISFPGRLYIDKKLFCMFSTDGRSRALPSFNPSVSKAAGYGFAILGDGIRLHEGGEHLGGTSFAAMLGAGLASRILDFSRQSIDGKKVEKAERLQTVEGMTKVFDIMVGSGIDNRYHCITPWKILRANSAGDQVLNRLAERSHICERISQKMVDLYI
ncbi:unnamed protein product [Clonostachys rosea]|uniref:Peptidase S8/S53 domain-containing protein n=1 Tax=Bionectria ochroleuca TaxID=29856 RepID=A0ABY6U540_BIOOC|nr:unnamed protein product [Clonostachys rosea]